MSEDDLDRLFDAGSDKMLSAVRGALAQYAASQAIPMVDAAFPLPISRASQEDYVRIAGLWKEFHRNRPVELDLPKRDCPGCASKRHRLRFFSHDLYPFHVCEECGSFFVPYLVEEEFIERFLSAVPEARKIADRMMEGRDRETMASDHERFDAYFTLAEDLAGEAPGKRSYLDIGCGVGHSIDAAAERGYEAIGLEISRTALATAHARGRKCFHPDEWQGEDDFQLVSLFETLEHVADPLAMLTGARNRLAKNGLMMITVPNGASWEVSMLSERCVHVYGGFDGVGHINLMTPDGIAALLRRAGFEPLLFDGQFGNNPLFLLSGMMDMTQPAMRPTGDGQLTARFPEPVYRFLSNIGPMLTAIDRAVLRSPIMIALACRSEDSEHFAARAKQLEASRRRSILDTLPAEPPLPEPPAPKVSVPQDLPLFNEETHRLLPKLIEGGLASAFVRSGVNGAVRTGLSVRSYAPLKFESVIRLGGGNLAAGDYEIAIAALMRVGAAALGVLDEDKGEWIAIGNIDPTEYWMRQAFRLEKKTRVGLLITANNVEPAEIDLELFDVGVAQVL
jgi:SAM-dependent methyltransferase